MDEQKIPALDVSVKVYPTKEQTGKGLRAFASVTLGGCFAINGIRVMEGEKGTFLAMPSRKGNDGKHHDLCCPTTKEMRQTLNDAVLNAYQKAVEKPSLRDALQSAAKDTAARSAPAKQRSAEAR